MRGHICVSINIFRKPIKLYFETLSLSLVTFPVIVEVFPCVSTTSSFRRCPRSTSLSSRNLWAMSPRDCLIALFHHFLSARLPPAEVGGISEPGLQTPWFLPRACFLLHLGFWHLNQSYPFWLIFLAGGLTFLRVCHFAPSAPPWLFQAQRAGAPLHG